MDTIEGMRTFIAVAAKGSFTGGAKRLGMTTRLASKYIRQLEERLGAQLFNRTTRSVTLTETGRAYYARCGPLLDQFDELEGLVHQHEAELAGPIRITAPTGFGSRELVHALHPFQMTHPNVSISMHLSDQHVSLIDEGFDIAIRFGALKDSSLTTRKLMDMRFVVFASPDYLAEHGTPRHPHELASHRCLILLTSPTPYTWMFRINGEEVPVDVASTFSANSPRAVTHMAIGGFGIGRGPHYAARPFLQSGKLKIMFEKEEIPAGGLYAVYPPGRHLTARIRALIDHLATTFR
ncbi:MAG: LysR family transcriptional regulator [Hyphomicrobiaceae bacterium]